MTAAADIRSNMVRIAREHGWEEEDAPAFRLILVRRVDAQCIRMWVDFWADDGTIKRALVAKVGGAEQALVPAMGRVLAFLKEHGS